MVKRMESLDRGPKVPPVFAGEVSYARGPIAAGDEVRCTRAGQEIYVAVLGASADGWLLGEVVTFGPLNGRDSFEVGIGELVEVHTDKIQAVLRGGDVAGEQMLQAPEPLLRAARR